jgi:hypothetical protein
MRRGQALSQPFRGMEGRQRVGVTAARQFKDPADEVGRHPRSGWDSALKARSARRTQGSASSGRP